MVGEDEGAPQQARRRLLVVAAVQVRPGLYPRRVELKWWWLDRNEIYLGPWLDLYLLGLNVDLNGQVIDWARGERGKG